MYQSKVRVQEFWYFVPGLDIQPELSEHDNPARKKAVAGCETLQVIYRFFHQIDCYYWHETMAQWLRWVGESLVNWVWFRLGAETLCRPSAFSCGTERKQGPTVRVFQPYPLAWKNPAKSRGKSSTITLFSPVRQQSRSFLSLALGKFKAKPLMSGRSEAIQSLSSLPISRWAANAQARTCRRVRSPGSNPWAPKQWESDVQV